MTEKEWKKFKATPEGGCLTLAAMWAFIFVFVLVSALIFTSCATRTKIEYVDRDVNHYITQVHHDTLYEKKRDSVYFEIKQKGDTIFQTKYTEVVRWRDRIQEKHDTCYRDSVVVQYKENIKEVKKVPKIYRYSLIFSIFILIFAFIKLLRWLRIF